MQTIGYGSDPAQLGDLRLPRGDGPHRVAVLFHGGFWRDTAGRDALDGVGVELARRGWATWNVAYRGGAGWRTAMADAGAGLDAVADLAAAHRLSVAEVVVVGYEAGGQVAMSAAAAAERKVTVAGVAGIAAVSDLEAAYADRLGDGAAAAFVGQSPGGAPDLYAALSPRAILPLGVPILVVHGDADRAVPVAMSRSFAGDAADAGDQVVYHELEGADHGDVSDPGSPAFARVADELDQLSRRIAAGG